MANCWFKGEIEIVIRSALKRAIPDAAWRAVEPARSHLRLRRAMREVARPIAPETRPHNLPGPLIVSLTSYPARFPVLAWTIRGLLKQIVRPDRVVLWIDTDEPLPREVTELVAPGRFEIRHCEPLRSYKKIIPALREWPDAYICTADDDVYYPPDWLETLIAHSRPGVITCRRAHRPRYKDGVLAPYGEWDWCVTEGADLFPTGVGGVLYPPGSLAPEVLDPVFMDICPMADDVWLYFMAKRAGSTWKQVGGGFHVVDWPSSQEQSLMASNLDGGNDQQIAAVQAYIAAMEEGEL